ncbi:MAG: DNA adenine methylase [Terriglobales bacterium]
MLIRSARPQSGLFNSELEPPKAKPFLKWAGGKTKLLKKLRKAVADKPSRYFEPFLGGGAMFFDLRPTQAFLSDSNFELILCYEAVRDSPQELIGELSQYSVSSTEFYRVRALRPTALSYIQRAARFIYLNKTCYNGLYRVNKNGDFNTPFGQYRSSPLIDEENLMKASAALKNAEITACDYKSALSNARAGDFVYLDPPYMPISKNSDFKRYTREFFYAADHEHLARLFETLADMGCLVLLSNSYHQKIADLYSKYHQVKVQVPRFVNCKGEGRGNVTELLISNYKISSEQVAA